MSRLISSRTYTTHSMGFGPHAIGGFLVGHLIVTSLYQPLKDRGGVFSMGYVIICINFQQVT